MSNKKQLTHFKIEQAVCFIIYKSNKKSAEALFYFLLLNFIVATKCTNSNAQTIDS